MWVITPWDAGAQHNSTTLSGFPTGRERSITDSRGYDAILVLAAQIGVRASGGAGFCVLDWLVGASVTQNGGGYPSWARSGTEEPTKTVRNRNVDASSAI